MSKSGESRHVFWITMFAVVVFVIYPLSVGPVAWLYVHAVPDSMKPSVRPVFALYFGPMLTVVDNHENLARIYEGYVGLFVDSSDDVDE